MKRMISMRAIGSVWLSIAAVYGADKARPPRRVCDETCKIEFNDSKAAPPSGGKGAPVKAPGFSVVSPVGRSAVKPIEQAPRLKTLSGTTIVVVTHELASIFTIATDSIYLDNQRLTITAHGNPAKILQETTDESIITFLTRGEGRQ